jgi:hypothetical protein
MRVSKSQSSIAPKNIKKGHEAAAQYEVSREEIQLQAYYNYLNREKNNFPGSEMTDWLEAENSLLSRLSKH